MFRRYLPLLLLPTLALAGDAPAAPAKPDPAHLEFFEKKIRPLLLDNCNNCHGPDKQKGGLRLDSRTAILSGGESGAAIVPGDPDKSRLILAVHQTDKDLSMPPKSKLTEDQIADLATWVKAGAPWPEIPGAAKPVAAGPEYKITAKDRAFWSFQPVKNPAPPEVKNSAWPQSPIDRFILSSLEQKNLRPNNPADKRVLLRRATFDLIGLPPTPEQIEDFLADESRDAFAKVIDRLLASPQYGERWARHWLDVARYGEDQAHDFKPRKYPDGFRYRDWVVKAFNTDLPYDRFVKMQIAGDLLPEPRTSVSGNAAQVTANQPLTNVRGSGDPPDNLAALGYFALGPVYYGGAIDDEYDDRIDTLSRGFLGLTVSCARCHDHKFDPIPTKDYYSLMGIFSSTDYKEYVLNPDGAIDDKVTQLPTDKEAEKKDPKDEKKDPKLDKRKSVLHALAEGNKQKNARVRIRGNSGNLGDEAPRRFLRILTSDNPPPFKNGSGRLELAESIASIDNPLTARVMVNRIWMYHFGRGIVNTPGNFGSLGERPTHPELLDYLATQFVEHGWSIKSLHRQIMLSSAYQMSSEFNEQNAKSDPDNLFLWRMNRQRLEVEPWRDAMLAVAGNLDATLGGPPADLSSADNRRRTLYGSVSRHQLDPLLRLFDFPDPNLTSDRRALTIIPLQQLFVLNSDFMQRQSKALVARVEKEAGSDDVSKIQRAFVLAYSRYPSEKEIQIALKFLAANSSQKATAWQKYAQVLLSANEFAFVD